MIPEPASAPAAALGTTLPSPAGWLLATAGAGPESADGPWLALGCVLLGGLGLLAASIGAFAAASLLVYSPSRLQSHRKQQHNEPLIADLEQREAEYQVVAALLLQAGISAAVLAVLLGIDHGLARSWVLAALGAVFLLVAGTLPLAVAGIRAEATLLRCLPTLRAVLRVGRWPLVLPLLGLTRGMMLVLGLRREQSPSPAEVAEQVMAAVADSVDDKALADEEKAWISNIVGLKEIKVAAVMTPRTDIVAMPADLPLRDAVQFALEHGFSRYPVYRDKLDDIVGVFYVKDALRLSIEHGKGDQAATVQSMMREPLFVPESLGVAQLLRRFQTGKLHMAIVLDEYGGTAGVVSVEDVLEQIVGDIADEYDAADAAGSAADVTVVEAGRVLEMSGRASVGELNRLLALDLPESGDWETVAGFVIAHCNRIPAVGETFEIDGAEFRVLAADDRRLHRLRVSLPRPQVAPHSS